MRVLYLHDYVGSTLEPAYSAFLEAAAGRETVALYDPTVPIADQFEDVQVVIDVGGHALPEIIDIGAAAGVKFWQVLGYGLDALDVERILEHDMVLAHTGGPCTAVALAEHALFLMLCLEKNLIEGQTNVRSGIFYQPPSGDLEGKTLGIIGLGASGQALADRARALDMSTLAVDVLEPPLKVQRQLAIDFLGGPEVLPDLVALSDHVSIHVPLTRETRNLVDRRTLWAMKPSAFLINVSRGAIVDEQALIEALTSHRIAGAGLDVFSTEPLGSDHPFLQLSNVIATPHVAGVSMASSKKRGQAAAGNIRRLADGVPPLFQITRAW